MELSGAEIVVRCLQEEGVEYVFGYPGGAVLHLYDELFKQSKVKHILVRHEQGALHGPVVGTVMSNLGLEHALGALGIPFRRAKVGDRHVLEMLRDLNGTIGGETSGHILCLIEVSCSTTQHHSCCQ